jgi:hypothetical protein
MVDQAGFGPAASTLRIHVATPCYNYVAIFQLIYWPKFLGFDFPVNFQLFLWDFEGIFQFSCGRFRGND